MQRWSRASHEDALVHSRRARLCSRCALLIDFFHKGVGMQSIRSNLVAPARKVVLGHGASGTAASMKLYVVGFKRRGLDALAVDLPKSNVERAVQVFVAQSGRDVVGGGQSYGGRMASMAAVEADFAGLVLFSYPLHRPGFPDQLRTDHFKQIRCPVLFMSGDRDPFARIELLKKWVKVVPNAKLEIFPGQGHGLLAVLDQALDVASDFVKSLS